MAASRTLLKVGSTFSESMSLLRTIYAIAIVLALKDVASSLYVFCVDKVSWGFNLPGEPMALPVILIALTITTFGLRFFWAVENIRRYVEAIEDKSVTWDTGARLGVHVGVLLLHAIAIFFLAGFETDIVENMSVDGTAYGFALCATGLLLGNAAWLFLLGGPSGELHPEAFWRRNNCWFGFIGIALLLYLWGTGVDEYWTVVAIALLYLLNSAVDYLKTWKYYFGVTSVPPKTPRAAFRRRSSAVMHAP